MIFCVKVKIVAFLDFPWQSWLLSSWAVSAPYTYFSEDPYKAGWWLYVYLPVLLTNSSSLGAKIPSVVDTFEVSNQSMTLWFLSLLLGLFPTHCHVWLMCPHSHSHCSLDQGWVLIQTVLLRWSSGRWRQPQRFWFCLDWILGRGDTNSEILVWPSACHVDWEARKLVCKERSKVQRKAGTRD